MEKGRISALQMALLLYPAIIATAILSVPSVTAQYAQQDLWLSPVLASFAGFFTVFLAVRLHALYPGQTIIQISEQVLGRFLGKVCSFFLLFFYIQSVGHIIRSYSDLIIGSFLFKTPIIVIIISMTLLCAFAIYGGLEIVARAGQLFFPLFVLPLFLFIVLLSPDFEPGNFLPMLEKGIVPPMKGSVALSGWFAEFLLLTFLLPFLADQKKAMKYGMVAVFAVMLTLSIVNLIVFAVLGSATAAKSYPLLTAGRYISYADFFENLESIIMAVWIIGAFVKAAVFYYVSVLGAAQWLNVSNYRPLVWPIGILSVQFSIWSLPSTIAKAKFDFEAFPFFSLFVQIIIPLLLLIIALMRKKASRG